MVAVALALLIGCAGSSFKFDDARRVEVGMTESQLTQLMGKPYSVTSRGDTQIWVWVHYNGLTGGMNKISFIMKDGKVYSVPTIPKSFD